MVVKLVHATVTNGTVEAAGGAVVTAGGTPLGGDCVAIDEVIFGGGTNPGKQHSRQELMAVGEVASAVYSQGEGWGGRW